MSNTKLAPDNRDLSQFPGEYGLPFLGKTIDLVKDTLGFCKTTMSDLALSRV